MGDRHDSAVQGRLQGAEAQAALRTLRQALQVALLGVIRQRDVPASFERMGKVFARLEGLCEGTPLVRLWQAAAGLVDELASGEASNDAAAHDLLRQVEQELRRLIEDGEAGASRTAPDALLDGLLFHASRQSGGVSPAAVDEPEVEATPSPAVAEERVTVDTAPDTSAGHGFSTDLIDMAWLVDIQAEPPVVEPSAPIDPPPAGDSYPLDSELADTFLVEAGTFVERIGQGLQRWSLDMTRQDELEALQRDLHTFKGGARLARQQRIGDLLHELEQHLLDAHRQPQDERYLAALGQSHAELEQAVDELRGQLRPEPDRDADAVAAPTAESDDIHDQAAEPDDVDDRQPVSPLSTEGVIARLRLLLQQVCDELGKQASLEVDDAVGRLSATQLGPLLAPLEHMLRNAIDHGIESPQQRLALGKPEQGLVCLEAWQDGGNTLLALSDDGAGIDLAAVRGKAVELGLLPAEHELEAREALQLVLHHGLSTAGEVSPVSGRGVGLDVVDVEVRQLGGTLDIESQPGIGTRFVIRLPDPGSTGDPVPAPVETVAPVPDEAPADKALRVLVVDDSATVRKVTCRLLERNGMQVSIAHDGDDAIERLHSERPDIMLLDIEMPNLGGFDVLARIRQDESLQDLPVVVITASSDETHRDRALELGVGAYLGKPYQEAQLLEAIEALVLSKG
ncbi:response regulator [Pseudomonas sp. ABC1]|uniref:ATP-binding response regulator n=1 Tax=Pseudomonas sp. ABC1 TaxID=2748080 RepID=UPI0015C3338B|nr:response regulator [Pseudomonas sp. ABC1]QLF92656.1 response regulator [Pseudomonas sp. ABC1]